MQNVLSAPGVVRLQLTYGKIVCRRHQEGEGCWLPYLPGSHDAHEEGRLHARDVSGMQSIAYPDLVRMRSEVGC